MAKCRHKGCEKDALFKSKFCWEHIRYKAEYIKPILEPGKNGKIDLRGANLEEANLWGANLEEANLELANLELANLERTHLAGANLAGANLAGANLAGADLGRANLERANLEWAFLEEADLELANLGRANLEGADLEGANLEGANLAEAFLEGAHLMGAHLMGAHLAGANLGGAHLMKADLRGAFLVEVSLQQALLWEADLRNTNLKEADLCGAEFREAKLREAKLMKANLTNADLRNANLNDADLSEATLTGVKVWGMSHLGCKTDGIKAEYLNIDKYGKDSGIVHLNKEQADEFLRSPPTIEILLQNELSTSSIRLLTDLIDKINERNPDWEIKPKRIASSSVSSELIFKASRDEILEDVANAILCAFKKEYQQKLLEYFPDNKAIRKHELILKELGEIKNKIENPVERITIIHSTGEMPVNMSFKESQVEVNVFGNVRKMVNVKGNYYEVSATQGRDELIRNLIDQLDSPEIEKRIKEAEAQLKGLSREQVKFLEEQFRQTVENVFKEKQKEVGFFDRVKAFSQRVSESVFTGVIGKAVWYLVEKFGLPG